MRLFRRIPVKLPWVTDRELTLYDITRACVIPHVAIACLAVVIIYYRGVLDTLRGVVVIFSALSFIAEPVASTLNLYHNGWGAPDRRFWCHLRAMYRLGHNPMRWAFDACTDACLLYATNGDVFAAAALLLSYHLWARAETLTSTPPPTVSESQDFALSIQPIHEDQFALAGKGNPVLGAAGAVIIAATRAHGYWIWGLYLCAHAFNTFLYVRRKQSYVQTDLQARVFQLPFRFLIAITLSP